jgi:hypothetical protein
MSSGHGDAKLFARVHSSLVWENAVDVLTTP